MPNQPDPAAESPITRRNLLKTASLGTAALAGTPAAAALAAAPTTPKTAQATADAQAKTKVNPDTAKPNQASDPKQPQMPQAYLDGTGPGWVELGEKDFAKVNSHDDTWAWREGVLYCTGKPISVMRTAKMYTNFEIVIQWNHRRKGGNSGLFVWSDKNVIEQMTQNGKPGLPSGIEVQMLDLGYRELVEKHYPNADTSWFTSHGDVFPVRQKMTPFPPLSPNKTRSFPSENRVKPHGQWNHYYVRAINGEVRLWVNGKEVSGGSNCSTRTGYLCLEAEGSPIEFRHIRIRELP